MGTDADGEFVIAWNSNDGNGWGVYAQRYSAAGQRLGEQFRVNTSTVGHQDSPAIAVDSATTPQVRSSEIAPVAAATHLFTARCFKSSAFLTEEEIFIDPLVVFSGVSTQSFLRTAV